MADIYSTLFFRGTLAANEFREIYTVPFGNVAVLRDIELYVSADNALTNIQLGLPADTTVVWYVNEAPAMSWHQWQGRTVVPGDQSIWAYCSQAGQQLVVSGYLLTA